MQNVFGSYFGELSYALTAIGVHYQHPFSLI